MQSDHDQTFLQILRDEKNIVNFLDAFFGFLYRCTDFYVASTLEQNFGFPPGMAEKLVLKSMYKWKNISTSSKKDTFTVTDGDLSQLNDSTSMENDSFIPPVVQEVEVDSNSEQSIINARSEQSVKTDQISESYNGAIRDKYIWTQTLDDLDVIVNIPEYVKTARQTRVSINSDEIKVDVKPHNSTDSSWDNVLNGKLSFKIRKDESTWSIVSGKHISIHLEKTIGKWWEALIVDEPKIELSKIDCVKNFNDMAPEEQMKVEELIWNHERKILGKPTSEQMKIEATLKKAWNAKGSPFQGTPYDPSILRLN